MAPIVVLCMIVRNESHVLARCIERVKPLIDQYIIVDTGSTDDTKDVARKALAGIPGEIHDFAWCDDYSAARNRALELAEQVTAGRPAYAWIVDADDLWDGSLDKNALIDAAYAVWFVRPNGTKWVTGRLFRLDVGWRYEGPVHEVAVAPSQSFQVLLDTLTVTSPDDGATWKDPNKYLKHAEILTKALAEDPGNSRYVYYLAQSYREALKDSFAAMTYIRRATMWPPGDPNEVYLSYLEAGRALCRLGQFDDGKKAFLNAHWADPKRTEAMLETGRLFLMKAATTQPTGMTIEPLPAKLNQALEALFEVPEVA